MSLTLPPIAVKASRACSTTAAPSLLRATLSCTAVTSFWVSPWISALRSEIRRAAACDSSASLRTSLKIWRK